MSSSVNISINLPKSQVKKIEDYLKTLPNATLQKNTQEPNQRFIKGSGSKENLLKLSGSWDNTTERLSANEIRKNLWQRKVRS